MSHKHKSTSEAGVQPTSEIFGQWADEPRWVAWKYDQDGKKPPLDPKTGRAADDGDPSTWATLVEAEALCKRHKLKGVGIEMIGKDGLAVVDLDGCRDAKTGVISSWAAFLIHYFDSYTEVSPSGSGVKIFVNGCPESVDRKLTFKVNGEPVPYNVLNKKRKKQPQIELFHDGGHYCCVTGQVVKLDGISRRIENRPEECAVIYALLRHDPRAEDDFRIVHALLHLTDQQSYEVWRNVGFALHDAHRQGKLSEEQAHRLWRAWSLSADNADSPEEIDRKWKYLGTTPPDDGITVATLFAMAKENGYQQPTSRKKRRKRDEEDDLDRGKLEPDYVKGDQLKLKNLRWFWPGRIPIGVITLLAGLPGAGKSHVFASIVAHLTTGRGLPPGEEDDGVLPVSVLIVCTEDRPEHVLGPRLVAAGADMSRVYIMRAMTDPETKKRYPVNITEDMQKIEELVERNPDIRMVIFDPITEFMGDKIEGNSNEGVRSVLSRVIDFADRRDISILAITHLPKTRNGAVQTAAIGSQAYSAASRSQLIVDEEREYDEESRTWNETGRQLLYAGRVTNAAKDESKPLAFKIESFTIPAPAPDEDIKTSRLVWDGIVERSASEIWEEAQKRAKGGGAKPKEPTERDEAVEFLKKVMAEHGKVIPGKPNRVLSKVVEKLAEEAGITKTTLKRAKAKLEIKSKQIPKEGGKGNDWYYVAPPAF